MENAEPIKILIMYSLLYYCTWKIKIFLKKTILLQGLISNLESVTAEDHAWVMIILSKVS